MIRPREDTFHPEGDQEDWVKLVKHAYNQWQADSARMVTAHPAVEDCDFVPLLPDALAFDSPIVMVGRYSNSTNEIFMVNTTGWTSQVLRYLSLPADFLFQCVFAAPGCVLSDAYGLLTGGADLELPASGSTDMLLNRGMLSSEHTDYTPLIPGSGLPMGNKDYDHGDVRFNTCQPIQRKDGVNIYFPYSTVLHEAGHTFGLSGYNIIDVARLRFYEMSHPTIPESVMNYDHEVSDNQDPVTGNFIRAEPDCAPYPFDLMALHALYQTVE